MARIVIGSRGSELARTQSGHIAGLLREAHPGLEVEIEIIKTTGDKITDVPLAKIGGKGLFTKELETALLEKRVDLAVHSLKDLPTELPDGLCLGAIPKRENPLDALVSKSGVPLDALRRYARVGTSSLRRKVQLLAHRDDLAIVDLRGNVPTRLKKLEEENLDAIVLAAAGLNRLGLGDSITEVLPADIMLPAAGQGALGLEIRSDDEEIKQLLEKLHDPGAAAEVTAERALLSALGGGCQTPVGALARAENSLLSLEACVCNTTGAEVLRADLKGACDDAEAIGRLAAESLLREGAQELIRGAVAEATGTPQSLAGKRIVVTRPREQARRLPRQLEAHGAEILEFPTIEIVGCDPNVEIPAADSLDWLIFTSANGVRYFASALERQGRDVGEFRGAAICAVGPATAGALRRLDMPLALTPNKFYTEALLNTLRTAEDTLENKRILLPRGRIAPPALPDALHHEGADVIEAVVYDTAAPEISPAEAERMVAAQPDVVTFTSASTAENFWASLNASQQERIKACATFAAIGPQTREAAEDLSIRIRIEPEQHDIPGLVAAIAAHAQATVDLGEEMDA